MKKGDYSNQVGRLNSLISRILKYYGIENDLRESDYFSDITEDALKSLGRLFGISPPPFVDAILYDRILKEVAYIHEE